MRACANKNIGEVRMRKIKFSMRMRRIKFNVRMMTSRRHGDHNDVTSVTMVNMITSLPLSW